MSQAEIASLVAADLLRVERFIKLDAVCSVDAVTEISRHLQSSGGKRLRPTLLLLSAGACGAKDDSPIRLGAAVEMIHAATLVHDDVIDDAEVRRGAPSTNRTWGNQTSVLAGDWLYMQAFRIAIRQRNFRLLDLLIELTQTMVEGELLQTQMVARLDVSEKEHLELIERKTASLFSVCMRFGAMVGEVDRPTEDALASYGRNLGVAFQLIDDVLDFSSTEERLGKPVGNDLREGKITLPLIRALRQCTPEERRAIETVVREGGYETTPQSQILATLQRYGTIESTLQTAREYVDAAADDLMQAPESRYRHALASILQMVVDRDR
ncbi:MAG: polyprenyl synthetase family protein [Acidobacteria bacterium]|nr:polyprenyl synthetase family protein [Acidobacteriota bacterium]